MKILVTGANGFIGREIVAELHKNAHEVIAVGNENSENKNSGMIKSGNYWQADVSSYESVEKIVRSGEVEIIIHCAGLAHQFGKIGKDEFWRVNVGGTKNVAELSKKLKTKHFILISSVAVYGNNAGGTAAAAAVAEDYDCRPVDAYAKSKLGSEQIARQICAENNIKLTILRPATVIGEGDRGNFLRLIKTIDQGRFVWIGSGSNQKSLIHKSEVANACLRVLHATGRETEIFNISGEPLSMKEIVDEIAAGLNRRLPKIAIPGGIFQKLFALNARTIKIKRIRKISETLRKWTADDVYAGQKISSVYKFETKIGVRESIRREVRWYRAAQSK